MESFLLFVDPASYESGQPSLSESRSRRFGMPSPSVSKSGLQLKKILSSLISGIAEAQALQLVIWKSSNVLFDTKLSGIVKETVVAWPLGIEKTFDLEPFKPATEAAVLAVFGTPIKPINALFK